MAVQSSRLSSWLANSGFLPKRILTNTGRLLESSAKLQKFLESRVSFEHMTSWEDKSTQGTHHLSRSSGSTSELEEAQYGSWLYMWILGKWLGHLWNYQTSKRSIDSYLDCYRRVQAPLRNHWPLEPKRETRGTWTWTSVLDLASSSTPNVPQLSYLA